MLLFCSFFSRVPTQPSIISASKPKLNSHDISGDASLSNPDTSPQFQQQNTIFSRGLGGFASILPSRLHPNRNGYELVGLKSASNISLQIDQEIQQEMNDDIHEMELNLDPKDNSDYVVEIDELSLMEDSGSYPKSENGGVSYSPSDQPVPGIMPRRHVRISLANNDFIRKGVLNQAPYSVQVPVILWLVVGRKDKAAYLLTKGCVGQWNLTEFYTRLIEYSQPQIAKCMDLFADSSNYPIVFHCTHGKDRTGVIAALVLGCLGVSADDIANDYSMSSKHPLPEGDAFNKAPPGMTKSHFEQVFLSANPETMQNTLSFVNARYGSVHQYLDLIGFGAEKQARLKSIMVEQIAQA